MNIKVSVIVPVYNAQNTLAGCLGNLVNQTLKELEIILVDDCSTDNSAKIIDDCKKQFSHMIQIISFENNQGPGAARNAAIEVAAGEYIGFVDSDDIVDVTMYEKMYAEAMAHNYDVVDCGFYSEKEQQAILYTSDELKGNLDDTKRSQLIVSGGYIWSKIFKKDIFLNKGLRFREDYILEDSDFITYVYSTIKSIGNVKEVLYKYTYTSGSLSSTMEVDPYVRSIQSAMLAIYKKEQVLENYEQLKDAVEYEIIHMYLCGVIMLLHTIKNRKIKLIKELQKEIQLLSDMALLKKNLISGDYESNRFIRDKISKKDISIMKMNDSNRESLIQAILKN